MSASTNQHPRIIPLLENGDMLSRAEFE
ncbi:MAG TPA: Uma2 family endonuclease, partial [Planktothrix sp. UBA10369]|nr:Uma2 family endonuclease [Planktothrix sp. UBA10369]